MLPMLCQGAIFASMFFALRGMAACPVESMKDGGALWFTDLTVPDPYYLLPLITSSSLFIHIKIGADGMSTEGMPSFFQKFMLCLPIISLPVMCQFPAVTRFLKYIFVLSN
jgi:YidC/Oxa1 family membrane protein insertase